MPDAAVVTPAFRDGWLVWEAPAKPVTVRLSRDIVTRLAIAVKEGFKALPRRGLETGGLLIGKKREEGHRVVVYVDDFEPVECEHATGPSYLLSDADRRLLESRIAARAAAGGNTWVVGFYRSHTRRDFAITPEDETLFFNYFRNSSDVFLLIKSNESGPPTAGFVIREQGRIRSNSPYAQFALEPPALLPDTEETRVTVLKNRAAPPAQSGPSPAKPRTASTGSWPVWLAFTGALVLGVGLPLGFSKRDTGSQPIQPAPPLALNVTNTGSGLRLHWDHLAAIRANHAVLWIKDGAEEQRFELDAKQLGQGSVAYWPRSGDVNFRLELPSGGAAESVRAIGGPARTPLVVPAPAVPVEPSGKTARRNLRSPAPRQLARAFALPKTAPDRIAAPSLPDPPSIQAVSRPLPERPAVRLNAAALSPKAPAIDARAVETLPYRVSVESVSAARPDHPARNIPLIGKRYRRSDYVPPVPLRDPGLSNPPSRNIPRDVNIDVKVFVDPSGKVDRSEVLSKVATPDRDLAAMALLSARQWQFIPARGGDVAMPGEVIFHYQFGPGAGGSVTELR